MSLFRELKRRNVFRVAFAYVVVAWLVMQVGEVMAPALRLPDWVLSTLAFFLILGFPLVLVSAWAFELTPEGIKREREVDRSRSIARQTGRKLDILIIAVLAIAVGLLLVDRFSGRGEGEQAAVGQQAAKAGDARKAIAVLPFQNLSSDQENAYFAAGVHEDILTHLSRIAELRVNSRTSVQQYADTQLNLRDVAAALGATYVVEGSVRRAGNRVRVTAQLIDATTDTHLWADNFDRELTDIFAIQTAIAQEIVDALQASLSPKEVEMISAQPTESIEAYDLFVEARHLMQGVDNPSIFSDEAIELLQRAVEIDPNYAKAWALLAEAHGDFYWFRKDLSPDRLDLMKAAVDRAFELQPNLPEAHLALANYYYRGHYDYESALRELQTVRESLPNDTRALHLAGITLRRLGDYDGAIDTLLTATRIDPAAVASWAEALETATSSGRAERAQEILSETRWRFPDSPRFIAERAFVALKLYGDVQEAARVLDSIPASEHYWYLMARHISALWARDYREAAHYAGHPGYYSDLVPGYGEAEAALALELGGYGEEAERIRVEADRLLAAQVAAPYAENYAWPHLAYARNLSMMGRHEEALAACTRATGILPLERDKVHGPQIGQDCAWVRARAGDIEGALAELEALLDVGWDINHWFLTLNPQWDFLRGNPRFDEMAAPAAAEPR